MVSLNQFVVSGGITGPIGLDEEEILELQEQKNAGISATLVWVKNREHPYAVKETAVEIRSLMRRSRRHQSWRACRRIVLSQLWGFVVGVVTGVIGNYVFRHLTR